MNELGVVGEEALYRQVTGFLDDARGRIARTVNTEMVVAYWRIGRAIVEVEQRGDERAKYGNRILDRLSTRLRSDGLKGMGVANLRAMRQFFLAFPRGTNSPEYKDLKSLGNIRQTVSGELVGSFHPALSWSHYIALIRVANEQARSFYEIEAGREAWSVSQLERQISAHVFERLAAKGNAVTLATDGQHISKPEHVLKDPFVEFLHQEENPRATNANSNSASSIASRASCSNSAKASASSVDSDASRSKAITSTSISSSTTGCCARSCWST